MTSIGPKSYSAWLFDIKQRVEDSICQWCGGVPCEDWIPFWVYDDYSECLCSEHIDG